MNIKTNQESNRKKKIKRKENNKTLKKLSLRSLL